MKNENSNIGIEKNDKTIIGFGETANGKIR
jgi:hypothetical protein